jgi:hypothetical protein
MRVAHISLALAFIVAVNAAASAAVPAAPGLPVAADDVVVSTAPAMSIANAPGYTLRFQASGLASYDGPLHGRDGHYEAEANFLSVQLTVASAHLCERSGIPKYVEALLTSGSADRTGPAKRQNVLVQLHCGNDGPHAVKTFSDQYAPDLPSVADTLLKLGKDLDWQYLGPARRQSGVRFLR